MVLYNSRHRFITGLTKKQIRKADDFVEDLSARQLDALPFAVGRFNRLNDSANKAEELDLVPGVDPLA